MEKSNDKKFYLVENLDYILSNGFALFNISIEHDDYGSFKCFNFASKDNPASVLRVPYKKLCYVDLVNNDFFIQRLNEATHAL